MVTFGDREERPVGAWWSEEGVGKESTPPPFSAED